MGTGEKTISAWNSLEPIEFNAEKVFSLLRKDDESCIAIYRTLIKSFSQIEEKFAFKAHQNLVGILGFQLNKILTGYHLIRLEIARGKIPRAFLQEKEYNPDYAFPMHSYSEIKNEEFSILDVRDNEINLSKMQRVLIALSKLINLKRKKIALVNLPQHIFLTKKLLFHGYSIIFPDNFKIHIPEFEEQWTLITNNLSELAQNEITFSDSLLNKIKSGMMQYLQDHNPDVEWDVLVSGTLSSIPARILAARTRSEGKYVFAFSHGERDGDIDEEAKGFSERAYCSHYITFGGYSEKSLRSGKHIDFFTPPPKEIPANSNPVRKIYTSKPIPRLSDIESPRIMYVPGSFVMSDRYGPMQKLSDFDYLAWQRMVLKTLPVDMYKPHPKQFYHSLSDEDWREMLKNQSVQIIHGDFLEVYNKADVYVLDFVSTPMAYSFATSKPIIYLDLGFHNPTEDAIGIIKKRCIYLNIRELNGADIYDTVFSQKDKVCVNEYTFRYSLLAGLDESREKTLLRMLKKI